jgi:parvulin-like peptidyl-prolyl isomerase
MARKRQTTALPKANPKKTSEVIEPTEPSLRERVLNRQPNREYKSRAEREAEIQFYVKVGVGIAAVIIVLILLAAILVDNVIRPGEAVASVGDTRISAAEFREYTRIERALHIYRLNDAANDFISFTGTDPNTAFNQVLGQQPYSTWYNELLIPDQMGVRVLDDMIDNHIVRNYAAANNITVSDEDVDKKINEFIGYDPERVAAIGIDPTQTPSPTLTVTPLVSPTPSATVEPTEEATVEATVEATADVTEEAAATSEAVEATFTPVIPTTVPTESREDAEQRYSDQRQAFINTVTRDANINESRLREYFRIQALREKVAEHLTGGSIETGTFANARHILVATEEEAQDVLTALENGASFAELARTVSTDEGSGANGGELGDAPVFNYVKPFAEAVRDAEIGTVVGPVESQFGFHIIQVTSREERELNQSEQNRYRQVTLGNWLEDQSKPEVTPNEKFNNWPDFVPQNPAFVYRPR